MANCSRSAFVVFVGLTLSLVLSGCTNAIPKIGDASNASAPPTGAPTLPPAVVSSKSSVTPGYASATVPDSFTGKTYKVNVAVGMPSAQSASATGLTIRPTSSGVVLEQ